MQSSIIIVTTVIKEVSCRAGFVRCIYVSGPDVPLLGTSGRFEHFIVGLLFYWCCNAIPFFLSPGSLLLAVPGIPT